MTTMYLIAAGKVVVIFLMILNLVPFLVWMERKGAAYIQDRRGPNRADVLGLRLGGLVHGIADALKMLTKSDVTNAEAYRPLFILAPMVAMFFAMVTVAVIPFAESMTIGEMTFMPQIADVSAGLLYVFALSSMSVYGILLAGWSSGSKYSMLGALRGASQMISYELSLGLSIVAVFLLSGSLRVSEIVADQGADPLSWNVVRLPLGFIIFFVALFAETNRTPFDLPEGESELAAGYHVEYSSMRFGLFMLSEYAHIIVGSLLTTMLFFGGWHIPFMPSEWLRANAPLVLESLWIGAAIFFAVAALFFGWRYRLRRGFWGDRRDSELAVLALLSFLIAGGLALAYLVPARIVLPAWGDDVLVFLLQLAVTLMKTIFFAAVFIWVRWTLPRFRYDQLMRLGWKMMLPLAMANVVIAGIVVLVMNM